MFSLSASLGRGIRVSTHNPLILMFVFIAMFMWWSCVLSVWLVLACTWLPVRAIVRASRRGRRRQAATAR